MLDESLYSRFTGITDPCADPFAAPVEFAVGSVDAEFGEIPEFRFTLIEDSQTDVEATFFEDLPELGLDFAGLDALAPEVTAPTAGEGFAHRGPAKAIPPLAELEPILPDSSPRIGELDVKSEPLFSVGVGLSECTFGATVAGAGPDASVDAPFTGGAGLHQLER